MAFDELADDSWIVAPRLLGSLLVRELNGQKLIGKIVEVEAYDQSEAASHSYKGQTPRTEVMFGSARHLYVYFTYGMHYCMNVVTGRVGHGSAVLIRAIEPLEGISQMRLNRKNIQDRELTNGPAKLCQALKVDKVLNGHNLSASPLKLELISPLAKGQIVQTTRIGISQEKDRPWRWYVKNNQFISKS